MDINTKLAAFKKYIVDHVPGFEVRLKGVYYPDDPWYRRPAEYFVKLLLPSYDTDFATTMYPFVYVPAHQADASRYLYRTLRHEYIHLRDEQRYGWWYRLSYLLCLPSIFTMRSYWESRGFIQNFISSFERTGTVESNVIDWTITCFTSGTYAWMNPFYGRLQIAKMVQRVESGEVKGLYPYDEGNWDSSE